MRQPAWDVYETVILIDAYYKMLSGLMTKKEAVKCVSDSLRKRAVTRGIKIDANFRNENGIRMRFEELSFIDSKSSRGLRNTSKLFRDTMKMYRKDKESFASILNIANGQITGEKTYVSIDKENDAHSLKDDSSNYAESIDYYLDSLDFITAWLNHRYTVKQSYDYISEPNKARNDMLYRVYYGKKDIMWVYMIYSKRSRYISLETEPEYLDGIDLNRLGCDEHLIRQSHPRLKLIYKQINSMGEVLSQICASIEAFLNIVSDKDNRIDYSADNAGTNNEPESNNYEGDFLLVEKAILDSDIEGITIEKLTKRVPSLSIPALKEYRDCSKKIIDLNGMMVHVDAIVGLDEAANGLKIIIEKLLNKNNGYVSSSQLYDYARAELQMFLNDNDLCSEQKVFDIARFLFSKTDWEGNHYEFSSGRHITRNGEKALKTNMDVFIKYARDMGGVFQWDDLVNYLETVGIKTGNLRGQMKIGSEAVFFYVTPETLITAESMKIDETWLNAVRHALDVLFNDVGDHIIIRHISYNWFEQLPELPNRLKWTPLLLQYVLQFYEKELGARTIHSELAMQYDSIHALLVKSDCVLNSFGDAVISFMFDNEVNDRRFQEEELRKLLVSGGLIGQYENVNNMQRAIGNDSRFAWDASGETVTLLL